MVLKVALTHSTSVEGHKSIPLRGRALNNFIFIAAGSRTAVVTVLLLLHPKPSRLLSSEVVEV